MVRFDDVIRGQLAITSWRHGRAYGGLNASLMIAHTLKNRVKQGFNSWLGTIENIPHYSATVEQPTGMPEPDKDFLKLLVEMDTIYDMTARDLSNGALYWADTTKIEREWFLKNVARNAELVRCANMGPLQFWGNNPNLTSDKWLR